MMLNILQNLGNAESAKGTKSSADALLNGKNGENSKNVDGELFKAMLDQESLKNQDLSQLMNGVLPENAEHLSAEEKEVLETLKVQGNSLAKKTDKNSTLLDILKGSEQSDVIDQKLLNQKGKVTLAQQNPGLQVGVGSNKVMNPKTMMLETPHLNNKSEGLNNFENKDLNFLNRLPQTSVAAMKMTMSDSKASGNKITSSMQYSEDFISTQVDKKPGAKAHIKTNSEALNLFSKEQAQLGDSGIIKRVVEAGGNSKNMNFDNKAKEILSSDSKSVSLTGEGQTTVSSELMGDKIVSLESVKAPQMNIQTTSNSQTTKVLDLSNLSSPEKIISEVTNYIEANKIRSQSELELLVNHKDLGQFKVHASKSGGEMIDLKIITANTEGKQFFEAQEVNLLKTLNSNGVKVSDFKLSMNSNSGFSSGNSNTSSQGQDNFSGSNNSGADGQNSRQYSGNSSFGGNGRERREELWNQYREKFNDSMTA